MAITPTRALMIREAAIREAVKRVRACGRRYAEAGAMVFDPAGTAIRVETAREIAREVEALLERQVPLCEDGD